nr:hypothetical protein CFP56_31428 [Quercus suber]
MTIAHVESSDDLGALVKELGEHSDSESIGNVEESDAEEEEENTANLQENYSLLLEKSGEYTRVAKAAVRKMKKAEEDYRSLLIRYKEAKCEIETLNGELSEAYTKVRFLEQEVVQAHAKIERVSSQKLDDVISSQKPFSDKSGLGYTGGSSSSAKATKEVKFVKAIEPIVEEPILENVKAEKKNVSEQRMVNKPRNHSIGRHETRGRSLPRSQRGPRTDYVCHYCGMQGHTRPNCQKLRSDNNSSAPRSRGRRNDMRSWGGEQPRSQNRDPGMMDVMKMIGAFTTCLESFTRRFDSPNSRTQSVKDITPNARDVWVKRGTHA